jgi:hypothetical protein
VLVGLSQLPCRLFVNMCTMDGRVSWAIFVTRHNFTLLSSHVDDLLLWCAVVATSLDRGQQLDASVSGLRSRRFNCSSNLPRHGRVHYYGSSRSQSENKVTCIYVECMWLASPLSRTSCVEAVLGESTGLVLQNTGLLDSIPARRLSHYEIKSFKSAWVVMKPAGGTLSASARRIHKELAEITQDPPCNCSAGPKGDNIYVWSATIIGPAGASDIHGSSCVLLNSQGPHKQLAHNLCNR